MTIRALMGAVLALVLAAPLAAADVTLSEIRTHLGRPMIFLDGKPVVLPMYSPTNLRKPFFRSTSEFAPHHMGAYLINIPRAKAKGESDFFAGPFWVGDDIRPEMQLPLDDDPSLDEQAAHLAKIDPGSLLVIRFGIVEPKSWRDLHAEELFVNDAGARLDSPSLASELFWRDTAREVQAVIRYCEGRTWAGRVIGYADFMRFEGSHLPLIQGWLYDHGPPMQRAWREFLKRKYGSVERLYEAYGGIDVTFDRPPPIPKDALRGAVRDVAAIPFFQRAADNQALRDYLELSAELFHKGFRGVAGAAAEALGDRKKFVLYDALKQSMLGWDNVSFFDPSSPAPLAYHDMLGGAGHVGVARLFDAPGFDGLLTPHDYQARGIGGVYQPEGAADTTVLRGKLFLCEMDTRSYANDPTFTYGAARNGKEFAAVAWRNQADALTRGFVNYWMDTHTDWFGSDSMHAIIEKQARVLRQSVEWPHETVPGIAMVLDDSAVLETNGDGRFANEAIFWEQKEGLARCGVPYRVYLLEDLALESFPPHRVFYFPNLFRVDDARIALLRKKVFRDGNVVLWGPGSGISDGVTVGPEHAARLTGFQFDWMPANYSRRVQVRDFDHPITRGMDEGTILGGPLAYGPTLFPKDGRILGAAWTQQGRNYGGLSVKSFGKGARSERPEDTPRGDGDWAGVFTSAVPIPATMWRGLARFAGAHVYSDTNDIIMADASVVALHSIRSGEKRIRLPKRFDVIDLVAEKPYGQGVSDIRFTMDAPETRVFLLKPAVAAPR
jgi:hypothetical protein